MAKRLTYNLSEAAEALGIRRSHLHSLISNGELASLKIGNRRLVTKAAVGEFLGLPHEPAAQWLNTQAQSTSPQFKAGSLKGLLEGASVTFNVTIRRTGGAG